MTRGPAVNPGRAAAGRLGRFGAWLNPRYDDDMRVTFVAEAEALGYPTAWLGFGSKTISDLSLVERALDATSTITVATAIVNMWTNDPIDIAAAYHRIAARHGDRFLLGVGIGHPESITEFRKPYGTMIAYLDELDAGGVPRECRILAALGPKSLQLAAARALGTHPYLVVPDHTRSARELVGPGPVIAPEHKVVLGTEPAIARGVARAFLADPYFKLSNYTNNLLRFGYAEHDFADGGSDQLIDSLVLHGTVDDVALGLHAHLDAGADHVALQVLEPELRLDPMPAYRALADALL